MCPLAAAVVNRSTAAPVVEQVQEQQGSGLRQLQHPTSRVQGLVLAVAVAVAAAARLWLCLASSLLQPRRLQPGQQLPVPLLLPRMVAAMALLVPVSLPLKLPRRCRVQPLQCLRIMMHMQLTATAA